MSRKTYVLALAGITLLSLALRLGYILEIRGQPYFTALETDPAYYDEMARGIAAGDWGEIPFFRVPLYPALLGAAYRLFGHGYLYPRVFQAFLAAAAGLLLAELARRLLGRPWALAAAALLALHGPSIFFAGEIKIVTLSVILDLAFLLGLQIAATRRSPPLYAASGLYLGLSVIARPTVLPVAPVALLWVYFSERRSAGWTDGWPGIARREKAPAAREKVLAARTGVRTPKSKAPVAKGGGGAATGTGRSPGGDGPSAKRGGGDGRARAGVGRPGGPEAARSVQAKRAFLCAGALAAGIALPILPVTLANRIAGGEWVLLATQGGVNFYIGNNPEASGAYASLPPFGPTWEREDARFLAESEAGHSLTAAEEDSFYYRKGLDYARSDPAGWAALMLRKLALFWNRAEIGSNRDMIFSSRDSAILGALIHVGFGILGPLGLAGLVLALRRRSDLLLPAGFVLCYMLGVVLYFVNSRFRMPVVAPLILLGLAFLRQAVAWLRERRWPALAAAGGLLAASLVLVWLSLGIPATRPAFGWFSLGNAHLKLEHFGEARDCYQRALAEEPSYPQGHLNIGFTHYRQGNLAQAEREFREELRLHPDSARALYNLGVIGKERGELAEAERWLRRAVQARPYFPEARALLASLLFQQGVAEAAAGRMDTAGERFGEAVRLDGSRAPYRHNYALTLLEAGRREEALVQVEEALRLDPGLAPARQLWEELRSPAGGVPRQGSSAGG